MLKKYIIILILILVPMSYVQAEFNNFTAKEIFITGISAPSKVKVQTISFKENRRQYTLNFVNAVEQEVPVYYKSTTVYKPLNEIPLNKKYYILTRDNFNPKTKNTVVEIYYIGTVPYPF